MKKSFALIAILAMFVFTINTNLVAQTPDTDTTGSAVEDTTAVVEEETVAETPVEENLEVTDEVAETDGSVHEVIKEKFIEGGAMFMSLVLIALIIGLALVIERIIYLNLADTNTNKLLESIESALETGGVDSAKEICRNTRGPVASIFYQGLDRADQGIEIVEKSVISYGSVQMSLLEKGLTWISLFITLAPMLGFMGTVIGMIGAFDSIQAAGDIDPALVAGGIKVALITTVSGLIVAMILQVFYNYIVSKVDSIVTKMEDASISLIDILVKYNKK